MSQRDIVVIPHGKSERIIANAVKNALRMPIMLFDPFEGERDIAIGNILEVMEEYGFRNEKTLHKTIPGLKYSPKGNIRMKNLVIFPILDVDSYKNEKKSYVTGNLFRDSPFKDRIHPILNDTDLDSVLIEPGYPISTAGANKTTTYHALFDTMIARDYIAMSEKLKTVPKSTNLYVFFDYCLSQRPAFQGKILPPF